MIKKFYKFVNEQKDDMEYNIGDVVRIREDLESDKSYGEINTNRFMAGMAGQLVTIAQKYLYNKKTVYRIEEDIKQWTWSYDMFEGKQSENPWEEWEGDLFEEYDHEKEEFEEGDRVRIIDITIGDGDISENEAEKCRELLFGKIGTIVSNDGEFYNVDLDDKDIKVPMHLTNTIDREYVVLLPEEMELYDGNENPWEEWTGDLLEKNDIKKYNDYIVEKYKYEDYEIGDRVKIKKINIEDSGYDDDFDYSVFNNETGTIISKDDGRFHIIISLDSKNIKIPSRIQSSIDAHSIIVYYDEIELYDENENPWEEWEGDLLENKKLNEELYIDSLKRLREAVLEIAHDKLKDSNTIKVSELCKILLSEYNINIPDDILAEILDAWSYKKDYTIFTKADKNVFDYTFGTKAISKNTKKQKAVFGKGRLKAEDDERWKKTGYGSTTTGTVYRGGRSGRYPYYDY